MLRLKDLRRECSYSMSNSINRQLLHDTSQALENGHELPEEQRAYAVKILRMVNMLAFDGYDLEKIWRQQRDSSSKRIRKTIIEFKLFQAAHQAGKGLPETEKAVQALRSGVHKLPTAVAMIQAIEGITQTAAQKKLASITGRPHEDIKSVCARAKRKSKKATGDTSD